MRMRAAGAVGVAVVAVAGLMLVGCAPTGHSCPAIGWTNTVAVQLEGDDAALDRVVEVRLCDDVGCSTPLLSTPPPLEPITPLSSVPLSPVPGEPSAEADHAPSYTAYAAGRDSWKVDLGMSSPGSVQLIAFDADGVPLGEAPATLRWVRVGGTAECGGPMQADAVELPVATPAG